MNKIYNDNFISYLFPDILKLSFTYEHNSIRSCHLTIKTNFMITL
jgi:hypothetical protein